MKSPWSKERRRAIQLLELIVRRTPLSSVQRAKLARASEALKSIKKGSASGIQRKAFLAVAEISDLLVDMLPSLAPQDSETRN